MRYFRAFYFIDNDDQRETRSLRPIHTPFNDKVFALPYRRVSWWEGRAEAFAVALVAKDGAMTKTTAQDYVNRAMNQWDLRELELSRFEESTVEDCFMEARERGYSTCCFDERYIRCLLNLTSAYSFISTGRYGMKEAIVEQELTQKKAYELSKDTKFTHDLKAELKRIYTPVKMPSISRVTEIDGTEASSASFAPITYVIENNTPSDAEEAISIIVGAMMKAGRIGSGHLFILDVDDYMRWPNYDTDKSFRIYVNHQLIRAIEGNTLIIRYGMFESIGNYDVDAYNLLTMILDLVESAGCNTQLFLSIPEGKPDLLLRLRKRHNKPMIVLSPDAGTALNAGTFEWNLQRMEKLAAKNGVTPDDNMRLLLSKRMRSSFMKGSACELEPIFDEWLTYCNAQQSFPQYAQAIDDAIKLNGSDLESTAQARLESLIGLVDVKEHIRNIILRVQMNQRLMESGLPRNPFSMHMVFLGAPGTGKTEVARLYAEILKDEGVLSEGRLITVSGGSGFNVKDAFEAAKGSVLFIDEAYGMLGYNNMVAELIAQMENNRTDTVVILAGYAGHMNALLGSNPGFRSRIGFTINFPSYSRKELQQIFAFMCEQRQIIMGAGVAEAVRDVTERGGRRGDQGNARFVRKLFEDAVGAQQVRLAKQLKENPEMRLGKKRLSTLSVQDVKAAVGMSGLKKGERSGREELEGLIGLESVKKLVGARMDLAKMQKIKRDAGMDAGFIPMHMAFKGDPGTGKTEVARLIGRILREEGVLSVGDFFECGKQDLVSALPGGSAEQIAALFQEARGSVVFIDEAYTLLDGGGDEAITALVDQMEKMRDEVVVIFAGYTDEIRAFLDTNPGLASRVRVQLDFPNYTADELTQILHHMASTQGHTLSDGVDAKVRKLIESAMCEKRFGNARFMRNLLEDALIQQSVRLANAKSYTTEDLKTLLAEDFQWQAPLAAPPIGFAA